MTILSWILGKATIGFYHAQRTLLVPTKSGQKQTLADLVKSVTPPCWLNPFLFNGHFQTIWSTVKINDRPIKYKRKLFEAENPAFAGTFAVDFVVHEKIETSPDLYNDIAYYTDDELHQLGSNDTKPMLIIQHGLSGGSHEIYLRQVIHNIAETKDDWEACVINSRGCAKSKITTGFLFNARATWDIRQLVKWLGEKYPNRPLYAMGFSLGGNILTNYVGEEGENCNLKAAIAIGTPYNLELCNWALISTAVGRFYSRVLGGAMRKLITNHKEILSQSTRFDYNKVLTTKTLFEFDRELQCPTWGYPTEGAYYRDASSIDALLAIRIPFLALHAEDDPIAQKSGIPYGEVLKNPFTVLCTTSSGGHLGWFEFGGSRWYVKPMVGFLKAIDKADKAALAQSKKDLAVEMRGTDQPVSEYLPTRRKLQFFDDPKPAT